MDAARSRPGARNFHADRSDITTGSGWPTAPRGCDTAAVMHMVTIEGLEASTRGWRAVPPVPLRGLGYPDGCRVTMPGDALRVLRPDGSVLAGTVGMWGVDAWRDETGNLVMACDPADPEVSVTIADIDAAELVPGSEVWVEVYPVVPGDA